MIPIIPYNHYFWVGGPPKGSPCSGWVKGLGIRMIRRSLQHPREDVCWGQKGFGDLVVCKQVYEQTDLNERTYSPHVESTY